MKEYPTFVRRLSRIKQAVSTQLSCPHSCLLCREWHPRRICPRCRLYFSSVQNPCQGCGIPLVQKVIYCGTCLKNRPSFDRVFSAFMYQSPLDIVLNNFKEQGDEVAGSGLSELFYDSLSAHYCQHHLTMPQALVAVPMQWRKQWLRGFNHAEILCEQLSHGFNIPTFTGVKRTHTSPEQKTLNRKERLRNLKHCFKVSGELNGKSIAIVDDVMTTGATANSLAKALKNAGANEVVVWALARTPTK